MYLLTFYVFISLPPRWWYRIFIMGIVIMRWDQWDHYPIRFTWTCMIIIFNTKSYYDGSHLLTMSSFDLRLLCKQNPKQNHKDVRVMVQNFVSLCILLVFGSSDPILSDLKAFMLVQNNYHGFLFLILTLLTYISLFTTFTKTSMNNSKTISLIFSKL